MKHEAATSHPVVSPPNSRYQCICCGGVIEMPIDQDLGIGLNLPLGLVSDECAFICDRCTANLIAAQSAQKSLMPDRRLHRKR
jgi:hypothetical protein